MTTIPQELHDLLAAGHSVWAKYVVRIAVDSVWDMGQGPHAGEELT